MDQFEQAVFLYCCGPPERFVNAQFTIPYDGFSGGSCPDFLVVDFADKTIYIVEVTSAADTKGVHQRVQEREKRWIVPLRAHFSRLNECFSNWDYHVTIFVRQEEFERGQKAMNSYLDVSVISLAEVVFAWNWKWEGVRPTNPLREAKKSRI